MKKHKAQLYDKIHNVISNYNDHMVRGIFEYDFEIDAVALGKVLNDFCGSSPVMHSAFCKGFFAHFWREMPFNTNDVLSVCHAENIREEAYRFIVDALPADGNVQLKIGVFINAGKSLLAVLTNHMFIDGGDLKYFMKTLCSAYSACVNEVDCSGLIKSGSRSFKTVYQDLDKPTRQKAKRLFSNPTPKNTKSFSLGAESSEDSAFIITRNIPSEKFNLIKSYGKSKGATINDMVLTAYFISLYKACGFDKSETLTVSGAIDLRRYMKNSDFTGLTNHSSYLPYTLSGLGVDFEANLKKITAISESYKSDPFTGLYGLPLLNLGYVVFPDFAADKLVKRFYNNPYIAMSNIGILEENSYILDGHLPVSAFLTGSVKYKPGIMVSLTTYKNELTLSMCCKGNDNDKAKLEHLLMLIDKTLTDEITF